MSSESPYELSPDLKRNLAEAIKQHKAFDAPEFKERLAQLIAQHQASAEFKERLAELIAQSNRVVAQRLGPEPVERSVAKQLDAAPPPPKERRNDDPFGFADMSAEELATWLGAGHAEVGSQRWEQAKAFHFVKVAELQAAGAQQPEPVADEPSPKLWERIHWQAVGGVCAVVIAIATVVALFNA
jgi:hypothetical protein